MNSAGKSRSRTAPREVKRPCTTPFESVALLLQGGGALGAYQAGVYEALIEHGIEPTWIAGISIGAINSAIIAGNPREHRVEKLRAFWELVSDAGDGGFSHYWSSMLNGDMLRGFANQWAAGSIASNGVRGFFTPRFPPPFLSAPGETAATSWYDTSALKTTLEGLVDFDRINRKETRFSVGAVNVETGNFAYFDNETDTIRAEHIMASGALPPAFPAIEIDGEYYWDGGLVSNTPLDWVLSSRSDLDTLVLQVDLWSARGDLPADLASVAVRMKEVQFSSRTRAATEDFRRVQKLPRRVQRTAGQDAGRPQGDRAGEIPDRSGRSVGVQHRPVGLSLGHIRGSVEGLRVQSTDDGGALAGRAPRCRPDVDASRGADPADPGARRRGL